jgi:hypothetical protein
MSDRLEPSVEHCPIRGPVKFRLFHHDSAVPCVSAFLLSPDMSLAPTWGFQVASIRLDVTSSSLYVDPFHLQLTTDCEILDLSLINSHVALQLSAWHVSFCFLKFTLGSLHVTCFAFWFFVPGRQLVLAGTHVPFNPFYCSRITSISTGLLAPVVAFVLLNVIIRLEPDSPYRRSLCTHVTFLPLRYLLK